MFDRNKALFSPSRASPELLTRREAIHGMAGAAGFVALAGAASGTHAANESRDRKQTVGSTLETDRTVRIAPTLKIATCQFPVGGQCAENGSYIRKFMRQAADSGAHLLHTSEASLSGYAGTDLESFEGYDWNALKNETAELRDLAKALNLWLVLGSAHFLDASLKPTNCLYLIDPEGKIVDRYDKSFCTGDETGGDLKHYSPGDRLVTRDIRGVKIGLAICYDICWPQLYIGYRELGTQVIFHSFHNGRQPGRNCLETLNVRQAPTRCADNRMWAVCNNSSQPYSEWGSFIARPDATIPKQLPINKPGILFHDFPDGLSEDGWYHNYRPMGKRDDEIMHLGQIVNHPRRLDPNAEPWGA